MVGVGSKEKSIICYDVVDDHKNETICIQPSNSFGYIKNLGKTFVKSLSKIADRKPKSIEYSIVFKFGTLTMVFESFDNLKWAYTLWTDKMQYMTK